MNDDRQPDRRAPMASHETWDGRWFIPLDTAVIEGQVFRSDATEPHFGNAESLSLTALLAMSTWLAALILAALSPLLRDVVN